MIIKAIVSFIFFIQIISSFAQNSLVYKSNLKGIPQIEIFDINGKKINTSSISNQGKPIIIDFWATWCTPCIRELNILNANYSEWKNLTGVKIFIISIDKETNRDQIKKIIDENKWTFEVLHDPYKIFRNAMGVKEIPCTFIINQKKNISSKHIGFYPGDEIFILNELKQISVNE